MTVDLFKKKCNACGICEDVCPGDIIRLIDGYPEIKIEECWHCGTCEMDCPTGALEVHPWLMF